MLCSACKSPVVHLGARSALFDLCPLLQLTVSDMLCTVLGLVMSVWRRVKVVKVAGSRMGILLMTEVEEVHFQVVGVERHSRVVVAEVAEMVVEDVESAKLEVHRRYIVAEREAAGLCLQDNHLLEDNYKAPGLVVGL